MKRFTRRGSVLTTLLLSFLLSALAFSAVHAQEVPDPAGFDQVLVYMMTGVYDPDDPNFTPPDGDFWHREIMGRSDEEIEQDRQEALAFFEQRFGIGEDTEGVEFTSFMVDPRLEYRAYVVSGREVPPEGWVVRDGGWRIDVTAPEGVTLGGEFDGHQMPEGGILVFGNYNIDVPGEDPIIIHYESGGPIVANEFGEVLFRCDLTSEEFGPGLAQGVSAEQTLEDGRIQANTRNILTFPGLGTAFL
jgi:hypothetical protein